MAELERLLDFLKIAGKLKTTLRYSELNLDARRESTADHSWRLSLMVFMVCQELSLDLNVHKAMKIALVHDLAESLTGDIDALVIARGEISIEEKNIGELQAMTKIKNILSKDTGKEVFELWQEYEKGVTEEAKFVKALDKLETITQLIELGYKVYDAPDFIPTYADKHIEKFPKLVSMLNIIKIKLKAEYKKGNLEWKKSYNKFLK
jgi:putative hydrolase of HD superfamily